MEHCMPIVDVNEDNFKQMYPVIEAAVKKSSFVAIDCELTGIGNRADINHPEVDLRYQHIVEIARSYAVISFGLSCFTIKDKGDDDVQIHEYLIQTFDVLTLCKGPFTVEPEAHKFLINHGFDFNKLYAKGLPYDKGCDSAENEEPNVRHLFATLLKHQKPVVIHNGLMDLVFLYQCFYADLPKNTDVLAADLSDMFPRGIYDTKYIAEFHQTMPATYLEYLFKKMQLNNANYERGGNQHVRIYFPSYEKDAPHVDWCQYQQIHFYDIRKHDDGLGLCQAFAVHGWCSKGNQCVLSHDINKVVKLLPQKGAKRRGNSKYSGPKSTSLVQIIHHAVKPKITKAKYRRAVNDQRNAISEEPNKIKKAIRPKIKTHYPEDFVHGASSHRAGFDAFMTGYIFAVHVSQNGKLEIFNIHSEPFTSKMADQVNKVYLMGKNFPFLIRIGTYASKSANHLNKIKKLRKK